jgi:hypothetical protein
MKNILTKMEVIDFYLAKLESFLGKKHQNLAHKSSNSNFGDSVYSGSPKSTTSERMISIDEDIGKEIEMDSDFDVAIKNLEKKKNQVADDNE